MKNLVEFYIPTTNAEIAIDSSRIISIACYNSTGTYIQFDTGYALRIELPYEKVITKLKQSSTD